MPYRVHPLPEKGGPFTLDDPILEAEVAGAYPGEGKVAQVEPANGEGATCEALFID